MQKGRTREDRSRGKQDRSRIGGGGGRGAGRALPTVRWSLSLCLSTQPAPTPRCRHREALTRSGAKPAPVITSHGSGCPHTQPNHAQGTTAGHGTLKITGAKIKKRANTPLEATKEVSHGGSRATFTSTQHPVLINKDHSER